MENKSYGRKEVRPGKKTKNQVQRNRFLIFTAAVLAVGIAVGVPIGRCTKHEAVVQEQTEQTEVQTTEDAKEQLEQNVMEFGAYDDRCFLGEISMDWSGDEFEFTPLDCKMDEETQKFVFYLCKGYNLDWTLVMAVIQHESDFDADCISSTNDYGLMQINKCNHEWLQKTLGVNDFLDSKQNIRAGVFVLRKLFEEYSDSSMVLMSYNMGEGGARKLWDAGIYQTKYSEAVLAYQKQFNEQLEK